MTNGQNTAYNPLDFEENEVFFNALNEVDFSALFGTTLLSKVCAGGSRVDSKQIGLEIAFNENTNFGQVFAKGLTYFNEQSSPFMSNYKTKGAIDVEKLSALNAGQIIAMNQNEIISEYTGKSQGSGGQLSAQGKEIISNLENMPKKERIANAKAMLAGVALGVKLASPVLARITAMSNGD